MKKKMMQKLKRNGLVSSKLAWGIWRILTWALKNLKSLHFNVLLFTKVYNVWAKKIQRTYIWWHWMLIQNFKENWLVLSKMTWRNWEIFTRDRSWDFDCILLFQVENLWMSLKSRGELCVMTMKNDAKFEEKLSCQFKIDMSKLTNFEHSKI